MPARDAAVGLLLLVDVYKRQEYPDYQDFLEGKEPMYQMVEQFEVPLRRLKDE